MRRGDCSSDPADGAARRFKRQIFVSLDLSSAQVDLLALERHAVSWIDEQLRAPVQPNGIAPQLNGIGVASLSLGAST